MDCGLFVLRCRGSAALPGHMKWSPTVDAIYNATGTHFIAISVTARAVEQHDQVDLDLLEDMVAVDQAMTA